KPFDCEGKFLGSFCIADLVEVKVSMNHTVQTKTPIQRHQWIDEARRSLRPFGGMGIAKAAGDGCDDAVLNEWTVGWATFGCGAGSFGLRREAKRHAALDRNGIGLASRLSGSSVVPP